ncbi:MAG TPA: DUF1259 domain-containing protein [Terriglobia bacterium]|nr:DUF1259 domain-containing protein [Terriglobia bacterium]
MRSMQRLSVLVSLLLVPFVAEAQGLDTAKIDQALGRSGQKMGDVYRAGFPRSDLHVLVHGVPIKTGLALGSWAAFSGSDDNATVMGDLVLLQAEVNPVMEKLRAAGFQITAVHNHLLEETPRVMYMHYMGQGPAAKLAQSLRIALSASRTPLGKPAAAPPASSSSPAWVKTVENALGRKGKFAGGVLSFGISRAQAVTMDGMTLTSAQGVPESINFQEAGTGKVATTGDFVLTAEEVNPVISALQAHHVTVTALHSHMLTEQPRIFFMHFWALGNPQSVALGMKAALSHVATK